MSKVEDKIIYEDNDGNKVELTIYLSYHSETFNKDYIVFYENDNLDNLIAGWVDQEGNIHDIESDAEYDELDEIIDEYQESNNSK